MDSTMFPFFEGSAVPSDAQRPRGGTGCLCIPQHHFLAPGCPTGGCHVHSESHAARPSGLPASQRKTADADSPISDCRAVLSQRRSCQALDQPSCSAGRVHPRSPQEGFAGSTMAQPVPVLLWAWCALTALAGAVRGSFDVSVLPEAPMVAYGGAVWINCSTTCLDPDARGSLETSLTKTDEKTGPGWVAFLLKNITEWVSAPQCYFTCRGRVKVVFANISAYRAPERVVLERIPELELGRAYNLTCRVLNVAPVRHLTVTLRQGGRILHTETFQNHTRAGPDNVTVTKKITPQQRDHGQEVTCHAALDLTPHEPHFENSSSAVELKVYALPEEPQLQIFHHIEVGTKATARCEVTKVFPAAGEAQFNLSFGGQSLNFTVTTSNDRATAQGEVQSLSAGERQLTCTVSVGPVSRSAGQSVLVYSLPEPILEITEPQTHVNSSVTVTCRSPKAHPPDVLLQLRDAKRVLVPSARDQPLVHFPLTAGEEDNGREFTCEARLASDNQTMKRTSARLTVLYGPRMDDSGCPREWTWKEGTEQTFSCQAQGNPAPAVVCKKDGVPFSIGVQQQVRREDAGTYHCEAFNMHGNASRDVTVHVEWAAQDSFEVSVSPAAPVVAYGGAVWINCSTTCPDPDARGSLKTSLTKTDEKTGPGWVAFLLKNITEWVSAPQCQFTCRGHTKMAFANISAYRAPERVVLERIPELELGRAYNLTCRVLNVAPVRHLTVTLHQGGRILHTETFQNHTRAGPDNVTVTKEITPQQRDHGQEVTCHAALDLTPHEPHFENSSSAVELKVYALPEEPQLQIFHHIEVGTKATARCEVTKVFPAAGEAQFNLSFGGQSLNFTVTTSNDRATAQGEVRSLSAGERQLTCTVSVGPVSRSAGQSVLVYSLPEPILEITEPQTHVNSSVTVTCRSPKAHPPDVLLQLRDAKRVLVPSARDQPLVHFPLTAGEEDNGREFTCEARLASDNQTMKRTSARLTVLYGPRMDDSGCPREWTWKEGTEQTFSCQAQGNPAPAVVCKKDGVPFSIGVQQQVRREDAGTYHCEASNMHGYASRDVTVHVEWAAQDSFEVSVSPAAPVVAYGGAVWINCSTTCPDPDARGSLENTSLTKTDEKTGPGWVAFLLKNITEWVSAPQCQFTCRGHTKMAFANISTYRAPERVVLERIPELELGRAYNLTCRVLNVAPVRHLTVTLRQGGRILHTETFQNHTRAGPDNVTVTKEITPQQRDHGQEVTCHAALDLTPHEPHFENSSSAVELKVYALPEEPQLQIFHHIEVGTKATARCEVTKVFPAAGEAQFNLSFGGQSLNFTVTTSNDRATAQGEVRSLSAGERQLTCTVSVGPVSRSAGQSVLVYSLPEPILEITEPQTHVNSSVTVTCRSPKAHPPDVLLQLRDAKRVLVPSARDQPLVHFPLTAGEEDNGREFTCEARLASDNQTMKRTSARLTVLYGPRMDDSGCPREWTWKEGTEQTFSCQAQGNPAPAVVCKKDGVPFSIGVQQQVRREDAGTYHCEASNVHGNASRDVTVHVEWAVRGSFEVSVSPAAPVVAYGGAVWINCSTTCPDPDARGSLETSLTKTDEKTGPGWVAFLLKNITEWVSAPQCQFTCRGRVKVAFANISAFRVPERVVLERLPELELGQAYNLTCRVLNVAPVRHLTVTLRQGGRTLHTETFQNHTRAAADNVTVTHEIIPQRQDHGQEVTCHSALDLRPLGQLFQNSSPAVELRVFALPEEPQLRTSLYIEVGTKATARCEVTKVFPAAGEAQFNLSFGGQSLNFTITTLNDTATAQGEVRSLSAGERQLTCTVSVGPVSRSAGQSVLVYSFPQPVLEIDQPRALVNRNVSLTCCSPASQPPGTTLQLRDSERTLESGHQPCLQLTLTARKGDNGRQFTCEGNLALGSHSFVKNTSAQLIVLYKPTLDESGCPGHQTWLEGTQQQLACEADGNPMPEVSCRKGSQVYDTGSVQNVTRGHAGVYRCSATSVHGTAGRNVTIHVEYGPEMDDAGCARTRTWVEETEQTLACLASGNPAPAVVCAKDGAPYGVGLQRRVAREHAGTYHCTATNTHGSARREVTVRVEYRPVVLLLAVSPSATVPRGANVNISCRAEGSPAPAYRWTVPPAPNVHYSADNSTVSVAGADRHNRGVYVCRVSNAHGQHLGQLQIQVTDNRLIVAALIAGVAVLLLGGTAGLVYYLKSTACKKGEYNVQDAESSSKATCLGRDSAVYEIQLMQT
ncbi:hemicentin-1 isoform X3 [Chelonia mydas]|uniref:hemicentin-1 isoform X3 n=1 Tax=Chelonia mydas TaxID=8469 RepID=UPI001CA85AC7|nr:hemicentin-1 isoform X3 [Chelonia mydas]